MGARMLRRPVKVAMTRPQLFHLTTHRSASEQRVRLGATADGRLTAYGQDALVQTCALRHYRRAGLLGRAHAIRRAQPTDAPSARQAGSAAVRFDARARATRSVCMALECAMDELAEALRPRSGRAAPAQRYPDRSGATRPFASRHLAECLREGAARFGWDKRPSQSRPACATGGGWSASASPPPSAATYCRARRRVRVWKATVG